MSIRRRVSDSNTDFFWMVIVPSLLFSLCASILGRLVVEEAALSRSRHLDAAWCAAACAPAASTLDDDTCFCAFGVVPQEVR